MIDLFLASTALLSLAIWFYLLLLRGGFWLSNRRLDETNQDATSWPSVVVLVPARDEEEVIAAGVRSLLSQDYPGSLRVVVIDDQSRDRTAAEVCEVAANMGAAARLVLVTARPPSPGWTGKIWALNEGLAAARKCTPETSYIWLSDADIVHGPGVLRRLVTKAERERLDLVSLMAELRCSGFWARLLIPPFVFFFQKLYPFAWVADPNRRTAAAAGGCTLLCTEALWKAGGFAAIRNAVIDDCALAACIKPVACARARGIWLGLADDSRSLRPYRNLASIWDMVVRSAYTQLRHSPLLLAVTLFGMALTYLVPPLALLTSTWDVTGVVALAGGGAWALMIAAYLPTLRLYRQPPWLAALLPLGALLYSLMTLASAWRHWCGRGVAWKGRTLAGAVEDSSTR